MNRAITWRWASGAKLYRLAARGRQSWFSFFCSFCWISQGIFKLEIWNFYQKRTSVGYNFYYLYTFSVLCTMWP